MYIKKQRLLTPGPTPLLPKALHAMMGSDIHHRTEDFRNLYRGVLADLKEVMGTSNDVLTLVASGTATLQAALARCPHVIFYRVHPITAHIVKRRLLLPWCYEGPLM